MNDIGLHMRGLSDWIFYTLSYISLIQNRLNYEKTLTEKEHKTISRHSLIVSRKCSVEFRRRADETLQTVSKAIIRTTYNKYDMRYSGLSSFKQIVSKT